MSVLFATKDKYGDWRLQPSQPLANCKQLIHIDTDTPTTGLVRRDEYLYVDQGPIRIWRDAVNGDICIEEFKNGCFTTAATSWHGNDNPLDLLNTSDIPF